MGACGPRDTVDVQCSYIKFLHLLGILKMNQEIIVHMLHLLLYHDFSFFSLCVQKLFLALFN
jgi:hypothetical protein